MSQGSHLNQCKQIKFPIYIYASKSLRSFINDAPQNGRSSDDSLFTKAAVQGMSLGKGI